MKQQAGTTLHTWEEIEKEALSELIGRKMIWGERIMLSHVFLDKGSTVPMHQHDNEQFSYLLKGELRFWVGEEQEEVLVRAGDVLHLPSGVPHGAEALEDSLSLDVFSPPRQDWIEGTDDYLREQ